MPTVNPRITVTLRPSLHAVLKRMSELTKNSQSGIVAEVLEQSQPIFEKMVLVIEAAQRAQSETKERVAVDLERAHGVLERQLGLMLDDLSGRTSDLVDELERIPRRAKKGTAQPGPPAQREGRAARRPPLLTGGSPFPTRTPLKKVRSARRAA